MTQTKRHSFIVVAAGHQARGRRHQQDGPRRLSQGRLRRDPGRLPRLRRAGSTCRRPASSRCRRSRATTSSTPATHMPWYDGPTLMDHLENVHIASDRNLIDFRFPVQFVNRPNLDFRGFCGTIASGVVRQGDEVMALPSRKTQPRVVDRHVRRRAGRAVPAAVGHAHADRRDRRQPRRHARAARQRAAAQPRVRGHGRVDGRGPLVPGK